MKTPLAGFFSLMLGLVAVVPAMARDDPEQTDYWHFGSDWGWGHMMFGSLTMVLMWGGIILLIVVTVRWLGGRGAGGPSSSARETPMEILQGRFARGEIDKEEYEERKRLLSE